MPILAVSRAGRLIGFKFGREGKLYLVSKYGEKGAREKARRQGIAIKISQGGR